MSMIQIQSISAPFLLVDKHVIIAPSWGSDGPFSRVTSLGRVENTNNSKLNKKHNKVSPTVLLSTGSI